MTSTRTRRQTAKSRGWGLGLLILAMFVLVAFHLFGGKALAETPVSAIIDVCTKWLGLA